MRRGGRLAALVVVLAAVLAGCSRPVTGEGTGPPRASDLLARTTSTMTGLTTGFAVSGSTTVGDTTVEQQVRFRGDAASGTVTRDGDTADLRRTGGEAYARAGAAFWERYGLSSEAAASVDGVWTVLPASFGLAALTDRATYLQALTTFADRSGPVRPGEVDGTPTWVLTAASAADAELAVTRDVAPRVLRVSAVPGRLDFTYPTDELTVAAPPGAVPLPS